MGYRSKPDGTYKAPPLPVFIQGAYRPKAMPCPVCGAAERASKATGCDYLPARSEERGRWRALAALVMPRRATRAAA